MKPNDDLQERPYDQYHKHRIAPQCLGWVRWLSNDVGDPECGVDCEICGNGKNDDADAIIRDQTAQRPIFHDLCCHEGVGQQSPEQSSYDTGMDSGDGDEGGAALFEEGASGDGAERERDGIYDE